MTTLKYIVVYNATSPTMAEAICLFLKSFQIEAFYRKEGAASAYGLYLDGFGGTKIFVSEEEAETAQKILEQMDNGQFMDGDENNDLENEKN